MSANFDYSYWLFSIGLFIVLLAASFFIHRYLYRFLFWMVRKTPNQVDDRIIEATHKTVPVFIFFSGIYQLLRSNPYLLNMQESITEGYQSFLIIMLFWTLHRFVHTFEKNGGLFPPLENQLYAPYMVRLVKVSLVFVAFYMLLENWGYDLSKLLAGVGITGIAFAFAARDTFSNIFSGMVIIMEKPFSVGDHISAEDLEGTITDINFRSTTIDTIDKVRVIVPNSKLINSPLTNKTKCEEVKVEAYIVFPKGSEAISEIQGLLKRTLPEEIAIEETVTIKVETVFEDCVVYKVFFFTDLQPLALSKKKQEYIENILASSQQGKLILLYLGFEKPNMAELKRGSRE